MNTNRITNTLEKLGLGYFAPFVRLAAREHPAAQLKEIVASTALPLLAFGIFVALWTAAAQKIEMDSGKLPTLSEVVSAARGLHANYLNEQGREAAFLQRQAERNEKFRQMGRGDRVKDLSYAGPPTFYDQILTSLKTVFFGFLMASVIAVPLGVLCGLSRTFNLAVNPLIQTFKPVSPLAWLPIVFILVGGLYNPPDPAFEKAFLISAGTVTLCCLWPTLINTAVGVAGIDPDHLNVARVLRLNWLQRVFKIVLPSALPLIFTGLRLSLAVGWMVLIAADMLAQNPGLGKFVWDVFQNGSSESLAQILVAVFTIGVIGFFLDRTMLVFQRLVSFDGAAAGI